MKPTIEQAKKRLAALKELRRARAEMERRVRNERVIDGEYETEGERFDRLWNDPRAWR